MPNHLPLQPISAKMGSTALKIRLDDPIFLSRRKCSKKFQLCFKGINRRLDPLTEKPKSGLYRSQILQFKLTKAVWQCRADPHHEIMHMCLPECLTQFFTFQALGSQICESSSTQEKGLV